MSWMVLICEKNTIFLRRIHLSLPEIDRLDWCRRMADKIEDEAKTVRQRIAEYLENMKDPRSISDIAKMVGSDRSENIIADINHALKSLKAKGITFKIMPATCKKCNFIFKQTKLEVKAPSKCPQCHAELIAPPVIKKK